MKIRLMTAAVVLLTAFLARADAQVLGDKPWTTVGAAGTVSTPDLNDVVYYTGGWVGLSANASTAYIRYNVVAVDGLFETNGLQPVRPRLTIKFLDTGENARVYVTLKEFDLNNSLGAGAHLAEFDSNNYAPDNQFQTRYLDCSIDNFEFDFVNKAYFLEVKLTRAVGSNDKVGLAVMQLGKAPSACFVAPH